MNKRTALRFDYKSAPPPAQTRLPRWWLAMALPVVGALFAYSQWEPAPMPAHEPAAITVEAPAPMAAVTPPAEAAPAGDTVDLVVQRRDTLERIFRRLKLSLDDLSTMLGLPEVRKALSRLRPGDTVTVVHADGAVQTLKRRISETEVLAVARSDDGFAAEVIATPIDVRRAHASGVIDSSLFVAARAAGVGAETVMQLANDIFGWQIDFALDIRAGDRFNIVYEQKYRDGNHIGDGRILAAEFINDGKTHRAIYYASPDGRVNGYFTPNGRSMHQRFLRAPLDFTRVSSNFNPARRHPILNTIRAHQGVDYAAASGTVIKAAGDGRVAFAGVKGGYGRVVTLEHGGGVSTLYAHMSGFARGLRPGQRVQQGQTIGFVGSSGAATGPHLHYEYRVNGVHKNPRTVRLPDAAPIPAAYLPDLQTKAQALMAELAQPREAAVATLGTN